VVEAHGRVAQEHKAQVVRAQAGVAQRRELTIA
jgi:hypothetical protein